MASKLDRAKTQLIIHHTFFATILLRKELVLTQEIPTACINASGQIKVNPDFIEPLTVDQVVFLLAHECMHWIMDTFGRMGDRGLRDWNIATDAVNNELLIDSNVGQFIEGGVRWPNAHNMTAEEVYEAWMKKKKQDGSQSPGGGSGAGEGGDEDGGGIGGIGSDLDPKVDGRAMTAGEAKALSAQVKVEVAAAAAHAKMAGSMPGSLGRYIDKLLTVTVPWHQRLERYMTERVRSGYSWCRPNRRFIGRGLYLPSVESTGMGEIPIIVDTSGSVSLRELTLFASHVSNIVETCQPEAVHVLYLDSSVSRVDTFTPEMMPLKFDPAGGGGTDMRIGVAYAEKHYPDAPCMIMLTDGYTPWPERTSIPLIVVTTGAESPVGECIKIEV